MSARTWLRISIVSIAFAAATGLGCEATIPLPRLGPHTGDDSVIVPYPPPAARPEIIPPVNVPGEGAVWVDGEWEWKGTRWVWLPGRWEVPYAGAYWAKPMVVRRPKGELAWYRGSWHEGPPPGEPAVKGPPPGEPAVTGAAKVTIPN